MRTQYLYDDVTGACIAEFDENGGTQVEYTTNPQTGELISENHNGQEVYHRYDGEGNTRQATDSNGNVRGEATYSAFGETVAESGDMKTTYRFQGKQGFSTDPLTGIVSKTKQNFSPSLGRTISPTNSYNLPGEYSAKGLTSFAYGEKQCSLGGLPLKKKILRGRQDHTTNRKKCVFVLRPWQLEEFSGADAINVDSSEIVTDVNDPSVVAVTIRRTKCCEILILGHQGAPFGNEGGATAEEKHGERPTVILPSADQSVENEIQGALRAAGCRTCAIYLYTCGGGNAARRDKIRQGIADAIGCDVWGTKISPNVEEPNPWLNPKDACSLDPGEWFKPVPSYPDYRYIPWPLHRYRGGSPGGIKQ